MPASLMTCWNGALVRSKKVARHLLELGAGELLVKVDGAVLSHGQVLEGDGRLLRGREFLLCLLGCLAQSLHGRLVLGQVDALGVLDGLDEVVNDALVPVVSAESVVAGRGLDLDGRKRVLVLADLEQGHVERAAAEVEHQDQLVFLALVQAVRECGGGGLVDDAQHVEARDLAGVLGGLALGVVEVRGHGDDRVGHLLAQVLLCVSLELAEDARADFLRRVRLAVDVRGPVGAHVALHGRDGAVNVGDGLALGDFANQHLAGLGERDHRRGGAGALCVCDDGGLATLKNGNDRVGGAEVNSYCS